MQTSELTRRRQTHDVFRGERNKNKNKTNVIGKDSLLGSPYSREMGFPENDGKCCLSSTVVSAGLG